MTDRLEKVSSNISLKEIVKNMPDDIPAVFLYIKDKKVHLNNQHNDLVSNSEFQRALSDFMAIMIRDYILAQAQELEKEQKTEEVKDAI